MDVYEELPEKSGHRPAPPPLPHTLVALNQPLTMQNALMQQLLANEKSREASELQQQ
jgi:hypothetical protein